MIKRAITIMPLRLPVLLRTQRPSVTSIVSFLSIAYANACGTDVNGADTFLEVTMMLPVAGATDVPVNDAIVARFNQPLVSNTVNESTFQVSDTEGPVQGSLTVAGNVATFTPVEPLAGETSHTATLTTSIQATSGDTLAATKRWMFSTAETIPPIVIAAVPVDGAVGVELVSTVSVTFSENVAPSTVNETSFDVSGPNGSVPGALVVNGHIATFTPHQPLMGSSTYVVFIATSITDLVGNALAEPMAWSFSTIDTTPPTIVTKEPPDLASGVPLTSHVTATFSEALAPGSVTPTTFTLSWGSESVSGTVSVDSNLVTFAPDALLIEATTYTAELTSGIMDTSGNHLQTTTSWSFTTIDVSSPTIIATSPAPNAVDVAVGATLIITFSEDVEPSSVTTQSVFLEDADGRVAADLNVSGAIVEVIPHAQLHGDTFYTATVAPEVADLAGHTLESAFSWSFNTVETIPPAVLALSPSPDANDVDLSAPVIVTFSEPLDPTSVNSATFVVTSSTGPIAGAFEVNGNIVTFTPATLLLEQTRYDATLLAGITDHVGNALTEPITWSFTTLDATPPTITSTDPGANATSIAVTTSVTVTFSEDIDDATVTESTLFLTETSGVVPGSISVVRNVATYTPVAPLTGGTVYSVTVTTGVADRSGNQLSQDVTWSFTTVDTTAPTVTAKSPPPGATHVPVATVILVEFSEAVAVESIGESSFMLTDAAGGQIPGTYTIDDSLATFVPSQVLSGETVYSVTVTQDVTDLEGNPLEAPEVWSFTTIETSPPTIVAVEPVAAATAVDVTSAVIVTFSEDLLPTSVTATTFFLRTASGLVPGTIAVNGNLAVFTPTDSLRSSTTHTVTITPEVMDLAGNPIGTSTVWSFTTLASVADVFRASFDLFQTLRAPNGVYRDALKLVGPNIHPASVATIGMGLVSLCIGSQMSWISDAPTLATKTLETMLGQTTGYTPARSTTGWFYHFISMSNGSPQWVDEISSIDTAILVAGALFAANCLNDPVIENLARQLFESVQWETAIADAIAGTMYRTFDSTTGLGHPNALTAPFSEYVILASMARLADSTGQGPATQLWNNSYADPTNLPQSIYEGISVLTDQPPAGFLSSFTTQFPFFLTNEFTTNDDYLGFMTAAAEADRAWWNQPAIDAQPHEWGHGAGAAPGGSGYKADKINDNPNQVVSPHIVGGFLAVYPEGLSDLTTHLSLGTVLYDVPGVDGPILWRYSIGNPNWRAVDIQGIDYSSMLLGLAAHFLGGDFFSVNNDYTNVLIP